MSENQDYNAPSAGDRGMVPNHSETFGTVPKDSEAFRKIPNDAEPFRSVPKGAERTENHTLTVREASRMFEAAGVARTERSIVNWCQPNRNGIARLDSYFDPNERKYYISPQSVELAIAEEKAKAAKINDAEPFGKVPQDSERFRTVPNDAEMAKQPLPNDSESREIKVLENEVRDLQITNRAKDIVIDQMQKERNGFFEQVIAANRKVGELEAKLLQLNRPSE